MHLPFSSTGHQSPKERKSSPPRHFRSLITRLAGSSRSHLQEVVIPPKIYATLITDYFTECSSFVHAHHWSTSKTRGCSKSITVQKVLENSQKKNWNQEPNTRENRIAENLATNWNVMLIWKAYLYSLSRVSTRSEIKSRRRRSVPVRISRL